MFGELIKAIATGTPKIPDYNETKLETSQSDAIKANRQSLAEQLGLATDLDTYNQDRLNQKLEDISPGYKDLRAKQKGIIEAQLRGELSPDVANRVQNVSAAHSLGGGYGMSGMASAEQARNYGISSTEFQNAGMTNASRWTQEGLQYLTAPSYDVTRMFITPTQLQQEREGFAKDSWNLDWMRAQQKAQPEQWTNILGASLDTVTSIAMGAFGGGMLGGAGGAICGGG